MTLKAGIIGLPRCGKTTIFNALTAAGAAEFSGAETNRAVVEVPDSRLAPLIEIYRPPKTVRAALELVDIPGLQAGSTAEGGRGNRLLAHVKDVNALLHVVAFFRDPGEIDPAGDIEIVDLEMVTADVQTVQNKIDRLVKKSRSGDKQALKELEACRKVLASLESGVPARKQDLGPAELEAVAECHLSSLKPVLYIANLASVSEADGEQVLRLARLARGEGAEMIAVAGRDEADLSELEPDERREFMAELGIAESSVERLIRAAYRLLGLITFFTAGPTEVHAWTCRSGDCAPVAAGKIHTDMETGFIRMEVIRHEDLVESGSEEAAAKAGKRRLEGKEYQVRDGDVVVVRFSN
ncbi:MAG TPA: redox-regulated ATPase YchF [bacterium]|nr:redox-regulated ATPase YchF [bacterium]HPQ65609.1 redox-regulated ATPase YchF [bacterium]